MERNGRNSTVEEEEKGNMEETKYQVMPPLTAEEYESLKADIAEHGVLVPVEVDECGNILDGHHRIKACEELGITEYPTKVRSGLTEEQKRQHARRLNLARRHLSQAQKRELICQQLQEAPDMSDRQIAKLLGVSHPTVGTVRREWQVVNFTTCTGSEWIPPEGKLLCTKFPRNEGGEVFAVIFPHPQHTGYFVVAACHFPPDENEAYIEGCKRGVALRGIPYTLEHFGLPLNRQDWKTEVNNGIFNNVPSFLRREVSSL